MGALIATGPRACVRWHPGFPSNDETMRGILRRNRHRALRLISALWRWIGQARPDCGRGGGFYVE